MDQEETKGEDRSADEAGNRGNEVIVDVDDDPWVKQMEEKLASKSKQCQPSHPFTICKVPRDIRGVDDAAHNPLVVSIGPYHRGDPNLLDMEQVKWRNLNAFRGRAEFNKYLKAMKEIEPRARDCYSGNIDIEADKFIEMMLLDGLFIIELLSNWRKFLPYEFSENFLPSQLPLSNIDKEKEPIFTIRGMLSRVGHDMLLLENQLPFFVLEHLWNLTGQRSRCNLWESAWIFIYLCTLPFEYECDSQLLQKISDEIEIKIRVNPEMINKDGVHHLLHLIYLFLISTEKSIPMETTTGSSSESMEPTGSSDQSKDPTAKLLAFIKKILSFLPPRCHSFPSPSACQKSQFMECTKKLSAFIKKILPFLSPSKSQEEQPPPLAVIPCAAELEEAGVEFQCVKATSFLDIKFEQGTMKMPRLSVQDPTKSLLRNFIAYEQCFPDRGSRFTCYCNFMDDLVNTPRDVEILKNSGIIENLLGCDKEVADLFNDLCKGIVVSYDSSNYLAKPSKDVRDHTKTVWPRWRAKLCHDYFGSPWSIISFLAATIVIILTIVQTCYAVFT